MKFKTCALKLKKKSVKLNCSVIQSWHVNDVRAVVNTHSPTWIQPFRRLESMWWTSRRKGKINDLEGDNKMRERFLGQQAIKSTTFLRERTLCVRQCHTLFTPPFCVSSYPFSTAPHKTGTSKTTQDMGCPLFLLVPALIKWWIWIVTNLPNLQR